MKSKTDTGNSSRQSDSGQDESGDAPFGDKWPSVQILRGNLLAMSKPFPGSLKQIFKMGNTLQALEARPKAVTLQGLEQSDALSRSLQTFPFSESDLISGTGSNVLRNTAVMRKVPPAARREKPNYPASPAERKAMPAGDYSKTPLQTDSGSAHSSTKPTLNQTAMDAQPQQATVRMPDEDFLAPGFMQQWIEEILAADTTANNTAVSNNRSLSDRHHSNARDSSRMDSIKHRPANVVGLPGHEKALHNPVHKKPGVSGEFDEGERRKRIEASALPSSPRTVRNKISPATANSQSGQHKLYPGASMHFAPEAPVTVFDGIALLQQMTQAEISSIREPAIRKKTATVLTNQTAASADSASWAKNAVWPQKIEKNSGSASPLVRGDSENRIDSASATTTGNKQNIGYHDESERIATLLNDALAEQAIRHGVDLS
jgi:hypothetical protein